MRISKGVSLLVAALAVALAAQAAAAGQAAGTPRANTLATVSSVHTVGSLAVPGADTGLTLDAGMTVTITATGSVCPFGAGGFCVSPDGDPTWDTTQSAFGGFVLPGAPAWGLVARVGSGPWVHVGRGPTKVSGTGVLVLAVNDDLFVDNAGSFTATVVYRCFPGWGWGDKNHTHCGPPGLANKPSSAETQTTKPGKGKGRGHSPR